MFSRQKTQTDVKKSTVKLLDSKRDLASRLKHLKQIIDSVDGSEAKALFATHYSHIYHLVYEGIVSAEGSLKLRGVHRAQREELDSVLHLLERLLMLLPDLLHCRWQLHSMSRLMAKLNHPANSLRLRREAIRLFIMWYQCLGTAAPVYVHSMFASLVPGLGAIQSWPPPSDPSMGIAPFEITPVLVASPGERQPEDLSSHFMELLLDFMVSQAPRIHWNEGSPMWGKSIEFLYERFKEYYLPRIFGEFKIITDIYKPNLELPEPRKCADLSNNPIFACQVVFVKWLANYAHSVYRAMELTSAQGFWGSNMQPVQGNHHHSDDVRNQSTPPSSLSGGDRDSITSYSSVHNDVDANVIAKDVILGSRENINFLHEVFRRALLMNFVHTVAIRRVICVYKDWIQMNVPELPVFMLEPDFTTEDEANKERLEPPKNRLRTDSYCGAVGINANNNREEYLSFLRAGAQKVLQVFFCNSAAVFLLFQIPKHEAAVHLLEEQVDVCKRVLNIYRYAVMNTRMEAKTWEQLLVVLLHVTSKVLDVNQPHSGLKHPDTLGSKLASALFQTLIVSWVKASLNVPITAELWDQLQGVLSQLTFCDELITEWSKTMETLTRVLSRHVYNLDLANLPLDRLTEQKSKKRRGGGNGTQSSVVTKEAVKRITDVTLPSSVQLRTRNLSSGASSDRKSLIFSPLTPHPQKKLVLRRSMSEGNILAILKGNGKGKGTHAKDHPPVAGSKTEDVSDHYLHPENRLRKRSRSADSIRKFISHFGHFNQTGMLHPDWAEISSSNTSLENTSTIHIDGDNNSLDCNMEAVTKSAEAKGVIAGGPVKGWLPSVAAILWRRMLGILGNVNDFTNPKTHAHFFQVLTDIWNTLLKIRQNQGISLDNIITPKPPELCPPLQLFSPWCFQALELSDEFYRGKILATALLCDITMNNHDIPFTQEYLSKYYGSLHKIVISNQQEVINEIVKRCGCKFVSKMLPGFSILLLDFCQAAHSVLTTDDLKKAPRMEASTILGTVLAISEVCKNLQILKPNSSMFQLIQPPQSVKDVALTCLIHFAKVEQTSHARAICLQSLTVFICKELTDLKNYGLPMNQREEADMNNRISIVFSLLLASIRVANRSVALVASDLLLLLADFANEVSSFFPYLIPKIILGLKWSLQQALPMKNSGWTSGKPVETEKRLLISLMLTLGEWCMRLSIESLISSYDQDKSSLLTCIFEVLYMVSVGYQSPGESHGVNLTSLEDFDPSIPFDDLQNVDPNLRSLGKENVFARSESTNSHPVIQDIETVRLSARSLLLHLLTQVGHFPMANGAARCGSIVSENDDLPGLTSELDELNAYVFSLPNIQLFALNSNTLLSIVELPAQDGLGGGIPSGFATTPTLVRIILRDLSGKASWDAAHLCAPPISQDDELPIMASFSQQPEDLFSGMTGSFLPQMGPRLTLRRRQTGILPTVENSADDLDNLDDLLQYIGYSSPECLLRVGEPLTSPWDPPPSLSQDAEDDVVAAVVNQRNMEMEFLMKFDMDSTMKAMPVSTEAESEIDIISDHEENLSSLAASTKSIMCGSSFMLSRRLFSHLGLTGWEKRSTVDLLQKDEKLLRELKHLDAQKCRETHKIAVIYVAEGQEDKHSILSNTGGSESYEDFVSGLGWEVELESHSGFMGGLQRNKSSGETAPYYATSFTEVIFHVATRMPSSSEESLLQKTRHLGNDEVHIVWSEHNRDYRRDIIPTEFCDVLIVIYPLQFGLYRVQISRKAEVPYFGPLYNEAVVEKDVLAMLVRSTAINASRARRSSLQFFEHHFEERGKSLSTIIRNHKSRTTFETFTANVFSPVLPPSTFQSGHTNRASGTSFTSSTRTTASTITANSSQSNQLSTVLHLESSVPTVPFRNKGPYHDAPFSPPGKKRNGVVLNVDVLNPHIQ
ncbi:unnamed protein product [Orchesella dallaii]|uniref:Rap-GAP domain-containing protein n=1 Tax=Orchesella dallaii TaxID=48710 RepID=A0ABP1Q5H9_9HEXA